MVSSAQKQASAARRAKNRARGQARGYPRVRARPIFPRRSSKVTRRCIGRRLLLSTGNQAEELTNFIGYCLAYSAGSYGIRIHASVWMSNHHHTDITDPEGNIVLFKQKLHSLIARGLNAWRGRRDTFWSGDGGCDTLRLDDEESLGDLVYTLTNPVSAGLVRWSRLWPGFTTIGWKFGETRTFVRPNWLFDEGGDMPEQVSLTLVRPPIFSELDDDALYQRMMTAVRDCEVDTQRKMREEGRRFMGLRKLEKQRWNRAPQSFEERFAVAPKHAASSKWLVLAELQRDRDWERQYAAARELHLAGESAVFPTGTYWLRRFAGVAVAAQPVQPP
ncbi:hypothetical protein ENSA5_09610 [Enhygromyxa salina]|uniref:Transposase n=1 Tax=Enhygromyxa salina TaxID=215803 RepID=A0A2S9YGJ7_9BACT|nr:hypothetical protein [Enhygromyxa salina]PRQ04230.1 hypothetical protein ENSA5_09610 [Enhygromyxa salina]